MNVIKSYKFLPKEQIERLALDILNQVQATRKRPLKGRCVAETVADYLDIGVIWQSIPPDDEGYVAAMIFPLQKEIIINDQIPELEGGFGQSTIAHEIGHWLLHIDQNAVGTFKERMSSEIGMTIEPFLCRSINTQKEIEWQAQYFASCLLMPLFKLEEARRGRDLTKWRHLYPIADELGVTISNLTHRLKSLGWIYIPKGSKQIYLGKALSNNHQ
ncbi:MAG: ImmA/IrrE family metallo-endopeptidase [Mastigocoleus sp. MO_167.B18]|uniref:ImmA/IrrE family metallo-endopeptidase n=1 Tax=Mastigocoleus sp. MO_188.B34 TaxID=3036635 RepID=UPI00260B8C8E|nr:ImmA/IrrE family metallo-endopeptidase [Mastigocoleus sp. MO_188.B34]MDJ0694139.1 ImmA/IrrE family metallo-endopeptidase [Mastigocoleus sp. MO_188.B34]MDJ0771812.1 ImmA/IrrE family metallo-endopeptidase [Mastigocoleus sp. MO_167.B18]